ncbi:hypothetical protein DERP_006470 [Dermatophagoides pteronyssinus]|uniref:Uncharacterized protein n=1 Tax=Dermatophagoides pteronyssinus TaxID=6956 RepID=A0ABQ8IQ88_DERPT|nr:hypothetical protein DERP_006470 [Dermatophagoides pteronyssinus]
MIESEMPAKAPIAAKNLQRFAPISANISIIGEFVSICQYAFKIFVNIRDFLTPVANINVIKIVMNAANRSGVWPINVPNFERIHNDILPLYIESIQALIAAAPAAEPIKYSRILLAIPAIKNEMITAGPAKFLATIPATIYEIDFDETNQSFGIQSGINMQI